jgi:hypothetical protein
MTNFQLLKEKLYLINVKLNTEKYVQDNSLWNAPEFKQSVHNEITLLQQKSEILKQLSIEIDSQLKNK